MGDVIAEFLEDAERKGLLNEKQLQAQKLFVKGLLFIGEGTYLKGDGKWVRSADYRKLERKLARPVLTEDEVHVLRILGNGQISAMRAVELIRDIRLGKEVLLPALELHSMMHNEAQK